MSDQTTPDPKSFAKPPPSQVTADLAAMEQHHKQLYGGTTVTPAAPNGSGAPDGAPTQEVIPPGPPEPLTMESLQRKLDAMNASYQSLQGKYNAETQRYRGQIDNLEGLISNLGDAPPVPRTDMPPGPPDADVLARVREDFGDDAFEAIIGEASRRVMPKLREIEQRVDNFNQTLADTRIKAAHSAREKMEGFLDMQLPQWRHINYSDDFKAWLQVIDVFARQPRHVLLTSAWNANDADSALAFFASYARERYATGAQSPSGTPAPQAGIPAPGRPSLDTFAAPGAGPSAAPTFSGNGSPVSGKRYRRSEILDLYARKRRGEFRDRMGEWDRIEADIYAAGRENRVDNG